MRLKFNRYRLLMIAELGPEDTVLDLDRLEKRINRRLSPLVKRGKIKGFMTLIEDRDCDWWLKAAESGPLRVIVAIGIPSRPDVTVTKASLVDRVLGKIGRVRFRGGDLGLDPRLALAVSAKVAHDLGIHVRSVDEGELQSALARAPSLATGDELEVDLHRFGTRFDLNDHSGKPLADGARLVEARDGASAVAVARPEILTLTERSLALEGALRRTLLEPHRGMTQDEVADLIAKLRHFLANARFEARLRPGFPASLWWLRHAGAETVSVRPDFDLPLTVSQTGLECHVSGPINLPVAKARLITTANLRSLIEAQGVRTATPAELATLLEALMKGIDPTGLVVASGRAPHTPAEPTLRVAIQAEHTAVLVDRWRDQLTDPRQRLPKRFVHAGELVAAVTYRVPGADGQDVYGQRLTVGPPPPDSFTAGDGCRRVGDAFFATKGGAIALTASGVSVTDALTIEGDVSATGGAIVAPGALKISGSVERGATIRAMGPIEIGQSFSGQYLRAKGSVVIAGGITAPKDALIIVEGDLKVRFIQSGRVRCTGQVIIESNMVGGTVEADGDVTVVDPAGGLFAGTIVAGGNVVAANVGRVGGQTPLVWFHTSARRWKRLRTLEARRQVLAAAREQIGRLGVHKTSGSGNPAPLENKSRRERHHRALDRAQRLDGLLAHVNEEMRRWSSLHDQNPLAARSFTVEGALAADTRICQEDRCMVIAESLRGTRVEAKLGNLILKSLEEGPKAS